MYPMGVRNRSDNSKHINGKKKVGTNDLVKVEKLKTDPAWFSVLA